MLQLQLIPESRFRYELPYLKSMRTFLKVPGNEYLESILYEAGSTGSFRINAQPYTGIIASSTISADIGTNQYQNVYLKPYYVAEPYEPLLDTVQPSNWTTVGRTISSC